MACCSVICVLLMCSYLLFMSVQGKDVHQLLERGNTTTIVFAFKSKVNSVRWQVLRAGGKYVDVSYCPPTNEIYVTCINQERLKYSAVFHNVTEGSPIPYRSGTILTITIVTTSETQFKCLTEPANLSVNISLEVYVMPSTPTCKTSMTLNQYVDLICETENVYPSFSATPHRRELDRLTFDRNASSCTVDRTGTGSKGDRYGRCTWRIPFGSLLDENTFYVEMRPMVWNNTVVDRPVVSMDINVTISLPNVRISKANCSGGPGVTDESIKAGTVASCRCELSTTGMVAGRARWYTQDGTLVGAEDKSGQFSVLSFRCKASDRNLIYYCRADNPTAKYYSVTYQPKCSASSPSSLFSGLTFVMGLSLGLKLAS